MMLRFCGHFYRVSNQQSNSKKFKDFETFEYYGIRIETNQNSNCMMKNTSRRPKFVRFRRFFKLCEFELKEFSCESLLVNSEGTEEFVRIRWSFKLLEFEWHEFNCISNRIYILMQKNINLYLIRIKLA